MSAVLTQDVSHLKAYPVGRPFFVRKHLTSVTGVLESQSDLSIIWLGGTVVRPQRLLDAAQRV